MVYGGVELELHGGCRRPYTVQRNFIYRMIYEMYTTEYNTINN